MLKYKISFRHFCIYILVNLTVICEAVACTDCTAMAGEDYVAESVPLVFAPFVEFADCSIQLLDDRVCLTDPTLRRLLSETKYFLFFFQIICHLSYYYIIVT